jgi:hypothetical protein
MSRDEEKAILKEALKEWLDERFTQFGKWSAGAISALALGALTYFILFMAGWRHL